jgi:hypothetical protein
VFPSSLLIIPHSLTLNLKIIGTHNGTFHCDEALAVFLLRQTATYRDSGEYLSIKYARI